MEEPVGAIPRLLRELGKLPGIGPKSAERITHHLLAHDKQTIQDLADALKNVADKIRPCEMCYNLSENPRCSICLDPKRDPTLLCVVEEAKNVAALERAGMYRGLYHVLQGRLAPLDNIGPEKLTIEALLRRVHSTGVKEVILATNPNMEGDGTALYISNLLAESGVKITRIARGIPSGSALDYANTQMLADALEGRRDF